MQSTQSKQKYTFPLVGGIAAATAFVSQPVNAQTAQPSPSDVQATVTSIGTVAAVAVPIVLGAMGVRLAIKIVNRLMVKG